MRFLWILKYQTVKFHPYKKELNCDPQVNFFDNKMKKYKGYTWK